MDALQLALKMGGKVSDSDPLELALQFGGKVDAPQVDEGAENVRRLNATRAMLGQVGDPTKAADAISRFSRNAWDVLNPITMAKGLYQTVAHPIDTVQGLVDAQSATAEKAALAEREGRGSEAAGYRLASNIPVFGPMIADLGEQAGSGDIAGAAGKLVGFAAVPKVAGATAKGAKIAAPVLADATRAALATRLPEAVGGITGGIVGGLASGAPGAIAGGGAGIGAVELMRSLPSVYQAIKRGVQARRGVSGAQAEAVIMKMPPQELAAAVEDVSVPAVSARAALKAKNTAKIEADREAYWKAHPKPEAVAAVENPPLPPGFTMDAKAMGGPGVSAEALAKAPSDIRPIPPSKLPPVLPDPVVPEISTKSAAANAPAMVVQEAGKPHPGFQALVEQVRGKSTEEALRILADSELSDWMIRPAIEKAGGQAPTSQMVKAAVERAKDARIDSRIAADAAEVTPVVTKADASGGLWNVKTGKRVELTPEQAREAVANLPWNRAKVKVAEKVAEVAEPTKATLKPALIDRIGKAISPDAAWKDLRKHGAGDGKTIPAKEAREMVDAVWSAKEPGYTSIEQWMLDRAERWERSKRER